MNLMVPDWFTPVAAPLKKVNPFTGPKDCPNCGHAAHSGRCNVTVSGRGEPHATCDCTG